MYRANNPNAPGMNTFGTYDNYNNSSDSHTHVSYKQNANAAGYFQRVGNSFCGIAVGFFILIASFPVIFLNEGRAVQTARSLNEGLEMVIPLSSIDVSHESNNNKLVHLFGKIKTLMPLTDDEFGIRVHAVHLKRHVEMYQWIETKHKKEYNEGDRTRVETTYSYSREWRSDIVKSSGFSNPQAHQNPNYMATSKYAKSADPVHVGIFQLSSNLKSSISDFKTFVPKSKPEGRDDLVLQEHYFYRSKDPYNVNVGDVRVSFSYAGLSMSDDLNLGAPVDVSIVARQNGIFLSAFKTEAGDTLELLYTGVKTAKEIFDAEHAANSILTWVLRAVGWLMMFIAFQIMMDILRQLVSFIPIVRDLVGLATTLLAFTFASSLSLTTIAIGWLVYRPMVSIAILVAAAVPFYLSRRKATMDKMDKE